MIVPCPKIRLSKLLAGGECIVRWVEYILLITISMCQRGFHHYSMCLPGKGGFAFLGVIIGMGAGVHVLSLLGRNETARGMGGLLLLFKQSASD
jgi:hypothetical protein